MMIDLLDELILQQKEKLFFIARRIIPNITEDDLLQPNDFPDLENHPFFRFEEGILDGLRVAKSALLAKKAQEKESLEMNFL